MKQFYLVCALLLANLSIIHATKNPFSNFRMSWRESPQHSAVIGWSGSGNAVMLFDTINYAQEFEKYQFKASISTKNRYRGQNNNFIRLNNLKSGMRYYFILRDTISGEISRSLSFRTLPENATSILIVIGGDSRNSVPIYEMSPRKCRKGFRDGNVLVSKIVPDVVAFGGDFVLNKLFWHRNVEWQHWLSDWQLTITPDGLLIPIIPTIGNHENNSDIVHFFDMASTNGLFNHLFGSDLITLTTLNDMKSVCEPTELAIMDSIFKKNFNTTNWQLVQYHIPMNPQGKHYRKRIDLIQCWAPLFQKWGIDLISESHTHIMKTTYPVSINSSNPENSFSRNDSSGIVFIGEGAWGAPLRSMRARPDYIAAQLITHGFHVLQVSKKQIEITAVTFENIESVGQNSSTRTTLDLPTNIKKIQTIDGKSSIIINRK